MELTFIRAGPRLHVVDCTGFVEVYYSLLIFGVVQGHLGVPSSKGADGTLSMASIPQCKANQSSVSSLQVAVLLNLEARSCSQRQSCCASLRGSPSPCGSILCIDLRSGQTADGIKRNKYVFYVASASDPRSCCRSINTTATICPQFPRSSGSCGLLHGLRPNYGFGTAG
jgi:hypothetical protein